MEEEWRRRIEKAKHGDKQINLNKSQIYINKESTYNINEGNNLQNLEVNALLKRD